jgi:hypothetical protein
VHVRATWQVRDEADEGGATGATISGGFPIPSEDIPVSSLQELLLAMIQATKELFGYAEAWESRKGLPLGQIRDIGTDP